jgi:ubiquinone/menaquinone biosynthesis C-methylase UbiE
MSEFKSDHVDERDNYYRSEAGYLQEHKDYLTPERTAKEVDFLVEVLKLRRNDRILDMACGDGRHVVELLSRGYNISGIDRSKFMLRQAANNLKVANLSTQLRLEDINHLTVQEPFDKAYLIFADIIDFDIDSFLESLHRTLSASGKFLIDFDSIKRVIEYLKINPESSYSFDAQSSTLVKQGESPVKYFSSAEIAKYLHKHDYDLVHIYGDYQGSDYSENDKGEICPRMIIIGEKRS